jgi:hypothetical protein
MHHSVAIGTRASHCAHPAIWSTPIRPKHDSVGGVLLQLLWRECLIMREELQVSTAAFMALYELYFVLQYKALSGVERLGEQGCQAVLLVLLSDLQRDRGGQVSGPGRGLTHTLFGWGRIGLCSFHTLPS